MKRLSFAERRYLIIKKLKQGYSYTEACKIVEDACVTISDAIPKKEKNKKISKEEFNKKFEEMISVS